MKLPWLDRIILLVGVVSLLVAGLVWLQVRQTAFSGQLCVTKGRQERVVVRDAVASTFLDKIAGKLRLPLPGARIERNLASGDIKFDDAESTERLTGSEQHYDIVRLPFAVQLRDATILKDGAPANILRISSEGAERSEELVPGGSIKIGDETFAVNAIQKWSGLVRHESGVPMMTLAWRMGDGAWGAPIFVGGNSWTRSGGETAARLTFVDSENAARDAIAKGVPGIESARWGVIDNNAINWFESFAPGTGAQLADGTTITLTQFDERHPVDSGTVPAIEVEIMEGGPTRKVWIPANAPSPQSNVRFEYAAHLGTVFLIYAWDDGKGLVAAFRDGKPCNEKLADLGEPATCPGAPVAVRVQQVMRQAVPLNENDSTLFAVLLQSPKRTLELHQSETSRVNDTQVEFVRVTAEPLVRYTFATDNAKKGKPFTLEADKQMRIGDWRFSLGEPGHDPGRVAIMEVEYAGTGNIPQIALAVFLAAVICFGVRRT